MITIAALQMKSEGGDVVANLARIEQAAVDAAAKGASLLREVLRLLATDLSGPAIARELVVSLNTVRTHTKNIYAKLGVNNRRAAVRRAEELDLLSRSGRRRAGGIVVHDE